MCNNWIFPSELLEYEKENASRFKIITEKIGARGSSFKRDTTKLDNSPAAASKSDMLQLWNISGFVRGNSSGS